MPKLNAGANVTVTLSDLDSITIQTAGVVVLTAASGLGIPAGKIAEITGQRTVGPYSAGQINLAASVVECYYEVADGMRISPGQTVISSSVPNNADGLPDGTIYVQVP